MISPSDPYGLAMFEHSNHRATLDLIAAEGPLSRAGVADLLAISRPSSSRVVSALVEAGLLQEGRKVSSKAGRRQTLLDINAGAAVVIGLSVRPNHVRLGLADMKGAFLETAEGETALYSAEELVTQIRNLVERVYRQGKKKAPLAAVAVGIAAVWDKQSRQIRAARNMPALEGRDLLEMLQEQLGEAVLLKSITVNNDINYAALGEMAHGAARGHKNFFYLNVGSGIGGGVVIHGRLHTGFEGFAGEVGSLPIFYQGKYRTLEEVVSRGRIAEFAESLGLGESSTDLLEAARAGDARALDAAREIGEHLAVGLAAVASTVSPELIVIGGSVGRFGDVLIPVIEDRLSQLVRSRPHLVGTQLGANASVLGAVFQALELARDRIVHVSFS
jgi:predicted NBD/HSP70 family sugar kinase